MTVMALAVMLAGPFRYELDYLRYKTPNAA